LHNKINYLKNNNMNSTTCLILLSNEKLASGHEDGKIKIWNTINGDLIKIFI
jgi:hypothetical protein